MVDQTNHKTSSNRLSTGPWRHCRSSLENQNGSVMILALMIMAIMMVLVIASSETLVIENYVIRNAGMHKQNVNLVESALMEGLQRFMQIPDNDPDNFDPDASNTDWINPRNAAWTTAAWYNRGDVQTLLNANNSLNTNAMTTLAVRGEAANGVLRCAVVGWAPVTYGSGGSESLVVSGKPVWHGGRILGEYVSADAGGNDNGNGFLRMELGVRRQW